MPDSVRCDQHQDRAETPAMPRGVATVRADLTGLSRWLTLAIGSLLLSGLLALLLVIGRAPGLSALVQDPGFFRRCLVVHVDLSLLVWLYAFIAGLLSLLAEQRSVGRLARSGPYVAAGGVLLMLVGAGVRGARPVVANYVPVIDHWSFLLGLLVLVIGIVLGVVDRRLLPATHVRLADPPVPAAAVVGLRATLVALLLAVLTFAMSFIHLPPGLTADVRYEILFWGGGHVLQLASTCAMVSVWLMLLGQLTGKAPIRREVAAVCFGLLVVPWGVAPLLPAYGLQDVALREAFTQLMRWGIFPPVSVLLVLCIRHLWRTGLPPGARRDPRFTGFCASAALTVLGYVLGALIRGSTTMIPAHYHAAIGAVTVAFMAASYGLLGALGFKADHRPLTRRLVGLQPALFGAGQAVFALGFAIAGVHGAGRKLYGPEQPPELLRSIGLAVMAAGGVVAISAGLLYLGLVARARLGRRWSPAAVAPLPVTSPGGIHGSVRT